MIRVMDKTLQHPEGHEARAMDQVTFRSDTVLSDVHLLLPNAHHLMTRLNSVGQPVFLSRFRILREEEQKEACSPSEEESHCRLDEDGDLEVVRKPAETAQDRATAHPVILSQAEGAISDEEEEEEEYGEMDVIKIDVGEDLLRMCQRNVHLNQHYIAASDECGVKVRQLDWTADDFLTDADSEFGWSEDEVSDLHDNTTVIIAADVCYDDDLTDALFRTLYRICSNLRHSSTAYISIEKRLNFTLRHMDVSCEAYDHFRRCLEQITELREKEMRFTVSPVSCSFPQFFQYERVNQLELWKVSAFPFPTQCSSTSSRNHGENDATLKTNPESRSKS
ncbi:methyltransferase-like protein 22 isoform X3 [Pangasianodon hypophthalmus]|uniref:methyltransferase-like protein 22 isoform X3 n=1 Tax=Pangasianodon hypophthalmus TaxID=310915 RepID=UPI0023072D0B|nr:methyltransferase-like protein 22 isoform X3 [Pangasianodon hypophthalmus]